MVWIKHVVISLGLPCVRPDESKDGLGRIIRTGSTSVSVSNAIAEDLGQSMVCYCVKIMRNAWLARGM